MDAPSEKPGRWCYWLAGSLFLAGILGLSPYFNTNLQSLPPEYLRQSVGTAFISIMLIGAVGSIMMIGTFYWRRHTRTLPLQKSQKRNKPWEIVKALAMFFVLFLPYTYIGSVGLSRLYMPIFGNNASAAPCDRMSIPQDALTGSAAELYSKAKSLHETFSGRTKELCLARACLQKSLSSNRDFAPAHAELAWVERKLGYLHDDKYNPSSLKLAEEHINHALKIDPKLFDAYIEGAYVYLNQRDLANTNRMIEGAETVKPASAEVNLVRAYIAKRGKQYSEAIERAKSAAASSKSISAQTSAYEILADSYDALHLDELAEEARSVLVKLDPTSPWAKINYASFLVNHRKNYDKAIELAQAALKEMDFGVGHFVLSQACYGKGADLLWDKHDEAEAKKYFQMAIEAYPENDNAYYGLGVIYQSRGAYGDAEKAYSRALKIDPGNEEAKQALDALRNQ